MKDAARIARVFHIDPITVLKASREEWAMRVAALKIVLKDREDAARKNKG